MKDSSVLQAKKKTFQNTVNFPVELKKSSNLSREEIIILTFIPSN